jgi:type VI secretion system protein ImpE
MRAKEFLDQNQLGAAIADLNQEVKQRPADVRLRTFLFELLCFAGEYDRAAKQLEVVALQDEKAGIGVEVYRSILRAEQKRRRVFSEGEKPTCLFDPPAYIQSYVDANYLLCGGRSAEAKALYQQAAAARPLIRGRIKGQPFQSFRDSDDRIAPVLEVFVRETYGWVTFERIKKLTIAAPRHLRDLLWIPATLEVEDGTAGEVFVPVVYAGSESEADERLLLGRLTEWVGLGNGIVGGVGQRTFVVDDRELSVLEVGELEFGVLAAV